MIKFARFATTAAVALLLLAGAPHAFAVSKEIIQLQTQVQELQDAVSKLQQSNDERMGVLKNLIEQTSDSVNKMSTGLTAVQQSIQKQQDSQGAKLDQVSGQIQSMNDSLDELRARLTKLDKAIQDIQSNQQSINAAVQQSAAQPGSAPTGTQAPPANGNVPAMDTPANSPGQNAPPVEQLYQTAFGDYNAAKYTLANAEFDDVIKFYPDNNLAGNAYFYLGEIAFKASKFPAAIKNYDTVLEKYAGNNKIPAAELRKGQCLLALKQNDAGVRELRSLIQRYPNAPEAMAARTRLNGMGVPITPRPAH